MHSVYLPVIDSLFFCFYIYATAHGSELDLVWHAKLR